LKAKKPFPLVSLKEPQSTRSGRGVGQGEGGGEIKFRTLLIWEMRHADCGSALTQASVQNLSCASEGGEEAGVWTEDLIVEARWAARWESIHREEKSGEFMNYARL